MHQAPLIRAICELSPATTLTVVTDMAGSGTRTAQGWVTPDFGPAELRTTPDAAERHALLMSRSTHDDVHVFSGLRAYRGVWLTLNRAVRAQNRVAVYAEPGREDDGWRAIARRLLYRSIAVRLGAKIELVLATGDTGCSFYRRVGFPSDRIRKFGYFTEHSLLAPTASEVDVAHRSSVQIAFVGASIRRKRLDLLLSALEQIQELDWRLSVIGTGPLLEELKARAERLACGRVAWLGSVANHKVRGWLATQDLLVLPSAFDGWGAVVNEALAVGTPVVASSACGASDLLVDDFVGEVFKVGNVQDLARILRRRVQVGRVTQHDRNTRATWASQTISASVGARYFLSLLAGDREARPPWETRKHQ